LTRKREAMKSDSLLTSPKASHFGMRTPMVYYNALHVRSQARRSGLDDKENPKGRQNPHCCLLRSVYLQ
jgi:hypothetical protein